MAPPDAMDTVARTILIANVENLVKTLDERPQKALQQILELEHRTLAVRNYLRVSKAKIDKKWARSEEEIREFMHSEERTGVEDAVRRVIDAFEAQTGHQYSLKPADMRRLVRPLQTQINYWNGNVTVRYLGGQLIDKLVLRHADWLSDPAVFKKYLTGTATGKAIKLEKMTIAGAGRHGANLKIPRSPTHATPGLSDHGRASAYDFVVVKKASGDVVAGTSSRTAIEKWDEPGWTDKLKQAVRSAGGEFEGPLGSPHGGLYEPWHYVYESN